MTAYRKNINAMDNHSTPWKRYVCSPSKACPGSSGSSTVFQHARAEMKPAYLLPTKLKSFRSVQISCIPHVARLLDFVLACVLTGVADNKAHVWVPRFPKHWHPVSLVCATNTHSPAGYIDSHIRPCKLGATSSRGLHECRSYA